MPRAGPSICRGRWVVSSEGFEPSRLEGRRLSTDVVCLFRHEDSVAGGGLHAPHGRVAAARLAFRLDEPQTSPPPRAPLRGGTGERRCVCVRCVCVCVAGCGVSGGGIEPSRVPCRGRQVARPSPERFASHEGIEPSPPASEARVAIHAVGDRAPSRWGRGRRWIRVAPPRRIERLRARFVVSPSAPPPGECPRALVGAARVCVVWSEGIEPSFTVRETVVLCR